MAFLWYIIGSTKFTLLLFKNSHLLQELFTALCILQRKCPAEPLVIGYQMHQVYQMMRGHQVFIIHNLDVFKTAPSEKLLQLIMGPD
jgi:hypothetical protein